MNTLLDTYADRITQRRFDQLCAYDTAKATAERVRAKMPDDVAAILMPLADRAVDSLRRVQDGFFFRKQRGNNNVVVRIPIERAATPPATAAGRGDAAEDLPERNSWIRRYETAGNRKGSGR